ncbi:DMT family transporter [Achromobacter sp. GG226]|uniref:DMT family transporter n=1 Tax=Verticiella alkaliphila TaxID=2779529 RepID=UPI001C0DB56B|nr:DMT family transporter [Verticiella sp. GG226]MBU4609918.1 DMT family transporter [Verticiella sp. GG226]
MQALWMLVATFMFSLMGTCVKLASDMNASLGLIVLMRGIPSVVMLLIWARMANLSIRPVAWKGHIWRNVAGVTSMWMGFVALSLLPLATAVTLNYTSPLFIAGWMLGWGGARGDRIRLIAVVMGFLGVLAVLRPTLGDDQWLPALAGLAAGASGAAAQLQVRSLSHRGEATWRIVLYFSMAVCLTGALALALTEWHNPTPGGWAALIAVGTTGLLGQLAMTRAFGHGAPLLSAALQYSIIIFASILGFLLWGDTPDRIAVIGMACIVGAGLLSVWRTLRAPG